MSASKTRLFATLILPLMAFVVAYSLGSARAERSPQSPPQAPAAQPAPQAPAEPSQQPVPRPRRASSQRQIPCWRLAGIAPALVNQRWHLEDNAKGNIGAVCKDPSLTAEKRREKIQEINKKTELEIAKIFPAKQFEIFKACQAKRDQEEAIRQEAQGQKQLGPCGGVIPSQPSTSQHQHQPANPKD